MVELLNKLNFVHALVLGICLGLLYYAVMYEAKSPEQRKAAHRNQIQALEGEIKKFDREIKENIKYEAEVDRIQSEFSAKKGYFPVNVTPKSILDLIYTKAGEADIIDVSLPSDPKWEPYGELLQSSKYNFNLKKIEFSQLMEFLSYMSRSDQVFILKAYTVTAVGSFGQQTKNDGPKKVDANLNLEFFRMRPLSKEVKK